MLLYERYLKLHIEPIWGGGVLSRVDTMSTVPGPCYVEDKEWWQPHQVHNMWSHLYVSMINSQYHSKNSAHWTNISKISICSSLHKSSAAFIPSETKNYLVWMLTCHSVSKVVLYQCLFILIYITYNIIVIRIYFTVLNSIIVASFCIFIVSCYFVERYDEDLAQSDLLVHDARGKLGLAAVAGGPRSIKDSSRKTPATWK